MSKYIICWFLIINLYILTVTFGQPVTGNNTVKIYPERLRPYHQAIELEINVNIANTSRPSDSEIVMVIRLNATNPVDGVELSELCQSPSTGNSNCRSVLNGTINSTDTIEITFLYREPEFTIFLRLVTKDQIPLWKRYTFEIDANITSNVAGSSESLGDFQTVGLDYLALVVQMESESALIDVKAGDEFWLNITIGPMPDNDTVEVRPLNLLAPYIHTAFSSGLAFRHGVPSIISHSHGNTTEVASPGDVTRLGDVNVTETVRVQIPFVVTDQIDFSSTDTIYVTIAYKEDRNADTYEVSYRYHTVSTARVEVSLGGVTYDIPDPLHLHTPITVRVPVNLPSGGGLRFAMTFESTTVLPFDFMDFTYESNATGLQHTQPARRKRSTVVSQSHGRFALPAGAPTGAVVFVVTVTPTSGTTGPLTVTPIVSLGDTLTSLSTFTIPVLSQPKLQVTKSVSTIPGTSDPERVRFTVLINNTADSSGTSRSLTLTEELHGFVLNLGTISGGFTSAPSKTETGSLTWYQWNVSSLSSTSSLTLSYEAYLENKDYDEFPLTPNTDFWSTLTYRESPAAGAPRILASTSVCLQRVDNFIDEAYVEHGYTVLMVVVGLVLGVVIAVVIVCCTLRARCGNSVSPDVDLKNVDDDILNSVILNQYDVSKRSQLKVGERRNKTDRSLVGVLALDQKMKQYRKLDSMDIDDTEEIDDDLEYENTDNRVRSSTLLVNSLAKNGDIDESTRQRTTALFKKDLNENDVRLQVHYKKELDTILNSLVTKNKRQFGDLVSVQQQERRKMKSTMKALPKHEKDEMRKLLEEKHKMEQQELGHRLALEQDEQLESTKKDFAIRRRLGIKDLQHRYLNGVVTEGKLNSDQSQWLLKQHHEQQAKLEELQDQEILNQKMLLEEKLARRKQLAQRVDAQEDDGNELLGSIEQQNMQLLERAKKLGVLDKDEVKVMAKALVDQMTETKTKFDKDRMEQERQLDQRLTARKRQLLADKRKQHESDMASFESKRTSDQVAGLVDPMDVVEARHQLLARQRAELVEVENKEDESHASELMKLRSDVTLNMQNELETMTDELVKKLEAEGMERKTIDKIIKQHRRDMDRLAESQVESQKMQEEAFQRSLAKNRKRLSERREQEKYEQSQLREHEEAVVRNIMTNQVAMSDEERSRIMREYEQQMVKMENSLTLNKLRQRRKLEERVSKQKREQLEKLDKRQFVENKKMKRRHKEDEDDMDRSEIESEQLKMMKKHVNQKLNVLHGDRIKLTDELIEIETEMAEERAMDIKKQEENLAAMMAAHQLEKANEVAKIHEQQRAIETLKNNLLNDLSNSAVLSDPECEQIIQTHQKAKERLNKKQDIERNKQEKLVQERLAERRKLMESQLAEKHEQEMEKVMSSSKSKTSARFASAMLVNKHMVEREQFKNRLEKEIDQTLEDIRQQHTIRKQEVAQELEMKFIAGLIRLGEIPKSEILQLLRNLCPLKTEAEIADMFQQIYEQENPRMRNQMLL